MRRRLPSLPWVLVLLGLAAAAWRWHLRGIYFGSEEEDYGNLGLILGTLHSGFRYVETEHMPAFTTLAAALCGLTGDAELAGELVAGFSGTAVVVLTTLIGWRWLSPAAGPLAGLIVLAQPELALYSATPLRITTYVAAVLLAVWALGERRPTLAALALPLAFLTRFDLAFSILPAAALLAASRVGRDRRDRSTLVPVLAAGLTVGLWSLWYHHEAGTYRFWGAVAARNEGAELNPKTLLLVLGRVLPTHLGRAAALLSLPGAWLLLKGRALRPEAGRWLLLAGASTLGLLMVTVLLSSYRWDHNLYWKWMSTSLPFLALAAAHAAIEGLRPLWRRGGGARGAALALVLVFGLETGLTQGAETRRQVARSDLWYGTQVRLGRWIERSFPPDVGILADLIPATWLARTTSPRRIFLWRQSELPEGDEDAFAAFCRRQRISLVIWFREPWVGAARRAPFLAEPVPKVVGGLRLLPIAAEPGYGFVAWQVLEPGFPDASTPPPPDAGATAFVRPPGGSP